MRRRLTRVVHAYVANPLMYVWPRAGAWLFMRTLVPIDYSELTAILARIKPRHREP